jgi:hypothetical protein
MISVAIDCRTFRIPINLQGCTVVKIKQYNATELYTLLYCVNCMSNLRLNIRILMWHIQISYNWKINVTYNDYHKGLNYGWFAVYEYKRLFEKSGNFDRDNAT